MFFKKLLDYFLPGKPESLEDFIKKIKIRDIRKIYLEVREGLGRGDDGKVEYVCRVVINAEGIESILETCSCNGNPDSFSFAIDITRTRLNALGMARQDMETLECEGFEVCPRGELGLELEKLNGYNCYFDGLVNRLSRYQ